MRGTADDLTARIRARLDRELGELRAVLDVGAELVDAELDGGATEHVARLVVLDGAVLDASQRDVPEMAAAMAAQVEDCAGVLVASNLRAAVLARAYVTERWPVLTARSRAFLHLSSFGADVEKMRDYCARWTEHWPPRTVWDATDLAGSAPGRAAHHYWPPTVAPLDVATWARDALNGVGDSPECGLGTTLVEAAELGHLFGSVGTVRPWRFFPFVGLALLYQAEREARASGRAPMLRLSATKAGRAAVAMLSAGPPKTETYPWAEHLGSYSTGEGWAELVWHGRPRALQFKLQLGPGLELAIIRDILAELAEDGLRDWLICHRMAAEQGASGTFQWTWAEHRERTAYASRVAARNTTDAEQASGAVRRLGHMQHAELRWYQPIAPGQLAGVRIGPFGLLDIPAGIYELDAAGRSLRAALVRLNPDIYEGAKRGAKAPHFALLPEQALTLPARELRLVTHVFYNAAYAYARAGVVTLKARTLWGYAGIRQGEETQPKHWPSATKALEGVLDCAGRRIGWNWTPDGPAGPERLYRIRPPDTWVDRAVLGVPPEYPRLAGVPRTGAELRAWRNAQGLSQRALASMVGVDQKAVSRAESAAAGPLPPDLVARLGGVG